MTEFNIGDKVLIKEYDVSGVVIEKMNELEYRIQRNYFVFIVRKDNLILIKSHDNGIKTTEKKGTNTLENFYKVDLHGFNKAESIKEVKNIIDNANIHQYKKIYITHGKGKGILRMAIHQLLKEYKNQEKITAYEIAQGHEGGFGVTIVYI